MKNGPKDWRDVATELGSSRFGCNNDTSEIVMPGLTISLKSPPHDDGNALAYGLDGVDEADATGCLSTFGRDADQTAEVKRRYQRQLTEKRAHLEEGLRFSIYTLRDMTVADDMARALVLACLLELYRDRRD